VTFTSNTTLVRHLDSLTTHWARSRCHPADRRRGRRPSRSPVSYSFIKSRFWLAAGVGLVRQNQIVGRRGGRVPALRRGQLNGVDITPTGTVTPYVTFMAGAGGSSSGTTPRPSRRGNATPVTANPAAGFHFVRWTSGGSLYSTATR